MYLPAFCNAHHLRELIAIAERSPSQPWATDMITLLCQANAVVGEAQAQELETLPASNANGEHLRTRYDTILSKVEAGNSPRPGTRERVKQSPAYNLIRRLHERRNEVLRLLTDLRVPFDNNQAECDLRMPKLKQPVSGCFRSDTGAGDFSHPNDFTPCRMALHFVSASAHAPHSDETPGPTATRGSSHFARRLRSLAFLNVPLWSPRILV